MPRFGWVPGFALDQPGSVVQVYDGCANFSARIRDFGFQMAIDNYKATSRYEQDTQCTATLFVDGREVAERQFTCEAVR